MIQFPVHGKRFGRTGFEPERITAKRIEQLLHRFLDQDAPVIHDDAVVDQPFHILDDVRSEENGFGFGFGVLPQVFDKEPAVTGIESHREVVQH